MSKPAPHPSVADLQPSTEDERLEAARAVYERRCRLEDDALVEALSERERLLIELTWNKATDEAHSGLSKALASPHAVTLDAARVRGTIERWRSRLDLFTLRPRMPGQYHDKRAVAIVRNLDHLLKQKAKYEKGNGVERDA